MSVVVHQVAEGEAEGRLSPKQKAIADAKVQSQLAEVSINCLRVKETYLQSKSQSTKPHKRVSMPSAETTRFSWSLLE